MSLSEVVFVSLLVCCVVSVEASKGGQLEGCAGFGACCPGKNVSCVGRGPSQSNKTGERCFCDEDCSRLGDCCLDYRFICKPINCLLSDTWSEWSRCDHQCGVGAQQRTRKVLHHPMNGGKKCTGHIERKMCEGVNCKLPQTTADKGTLNDTKVGETANIVPGVYAPWRQNVLYNPLVDIRQSLFLHQLKYSSLLKEKQPSYCAKFRVTETRGACHRRSSPDQPPPRTKALTVGAIVCVECQPFGILQRTRSSKCIGDGIYMMETAWNAVTAPRCHGKWVMTSQHQTPCQCDPNSENSFIFV